MPCVAIQHSGSEGVRWSNLIKEKNNRALLYYKRRRISRGLYDHQTRRHFALSVNIISRVQQHQWQTDRQTLRRCDFERAFGGASAVRKTIWLMESTVQTFSARHRAGPLLLMCKIVQFLWKLGLLLRENELCVQRYCKQLLMKLNNPAISHSMDANCIQHF